MRWPAGLVARPLGRSDVPAWAALLAAAEAWDDHGTSFDADALGEELGSPYLDVALDTLGLWDGSRMVGCAKVWTRSGAVDVDRVWIDGRVHPAWRRRGLGRLLLEWGCARARVAHASRDPGVPGEFQGRCNATNVGASALFGGAGFALARFYVGMERSLSLPIPPAPVPPGLLLVPFDPRWDEATRVTHNEAFRGHWGSRPRSEKDWRASVTGLRTFRGRALTAAAAEGFAVATLGVDAENATGALGLYERIGFVARRKTANYSQEM